MDYYQAAQPAIAAVIVGLTYAWVKYRSNILDPTKPTPEGFDWTKAGYTVLLAIIISIVYTLMGNPLDVTGLEQQMALYGGLTYFLEPPIQALIRWFGDLKIGE